MVQAISRWLFTTEVPTSNPVSPCAICGGYSDTVTGFSQSIAPSASFCQNSIFIHLSPTPCNFSS